MKQKLDLEELRELIKLEEQLSDSSEETEQEEKVQAEMKEQEEVLEDDEEEVIIEIKFAEDEENDDEEADEEADEDDEEIEDEDAEEMKKAPKYSKKKLKKLKSRLREIEAELADELVENGDSAYAEELECEYDRLENELIELEDAKAKKGTRKKYVFGTIAGVTAITSMVVVALKFRKSMKKK